ncbi:HAD-IA family hydrolase [Hellea balneolensis]|uniref:HAD-IA family hydrolase n=1 Tax=Hellea balneolensis TaxID=287478 RepID=UPI000409EFAC|nr:HAD-IA family hydrolase [Hellea balneolensis]
MSTLTHLSLCFDLDGTLIDTAPDLVRVLNDVIAEEGLAETDFTEARKAVGFGSRALINGALARANHAVDESRIDELQKLFLELYAEDICRLSTPFPGVVDTLKALKARGAELSVCTNKPGYLARPLIEALGLSRLFVRVVGSDDLVRNKPYADHIWKAAGHRGRSRKIIMVGDSLPDMLSAKNAKVPCLLMVYGYSTIPVVKLGGDRILRNFREILPAAIELSA